MTAASCRTRIETQCNANRPAAGAFDERVARACLDEMSEALTACTIPPRWSPLAAYQFRCEAVFGTKRVDDECTSIAECKQDPTGLPITCMQYALDAPKRCTPLAAGVDSYQRCAMVDGVFVQCLRGAPCVVDPMTTIGFCDPPGSSLCGGKCPGDTVCIDSTCGMRLEDGARCGNEFQCLSGVCTNYRCGWQKFPEKCW